MHRRRSVDPLSISTTGWLNSLESLDFSSLEQLPGVDRKLVSRYRSWLRTCCSILAKEAVVPETRRVPREFVHKLFDILGGDESASVFSAPSRNRDRVIATMRRLCRDTTLWPQEVDFRERFPSRAFDAADAVQQSAEFLGPAQRYTMLYNQYVSDKAKYASRRGWFLGVIPYWWQEAVPTRRSQQAAGRGVSFEEYLKLRKAPGDLLPKEPAPVVVEPPRPQYVPPFLGVRPSGQARRRPTSGAGRLADNYFRMMERSAGARTAVRGRVASKDPQKRWGPGKK